MPILKTKLLISRMVAGQVLRVDATDPHSMVDFEAFCAKTGHRLEACTMEGNKIFCFYILRKNTATPVRDGAENSASSE